MGAVYIAFYKGRSSKNGIKAALHRAWDWTVRILTFGEYSHCEVAIPAQLDGMYCCYSSSGRDGGVRMKVMPLPPEKWDLVPVKQSVEAVLKLYHETSQQKYDWLGAISTVLPFALQCRKRWFCSEWAAAAVGLMEPERYEPNLLHWAVSRDIFYHYLKSHKFD